MLLKNLIKNISNDKKNIVISGLSTNSKDIKKNYIYFRSPIGRSLIGKKIGDLVTVKTPAGEKNFEVKEVKYI